MEEPMRTFSLALLLALALGRPAGAAGPVLPLPPADEQEITRVLGPGIVGKALPSDPITDASVYFPLEERASVFQVTSARTKASSRRSAR
jgi:hypothetical protein